MKHREPNTTEIESANYHFVLKLYAVAMSAKIDTDTGSIVSTFPGVVTRDCKEAAISAGLEMVKERFPMSARYYSHECAVVEIPDEILGIVRPR